jgi:hypothetical protein
LTFDELLDRRDALRDLHASYCDDVHGPLGAGEDTLEARGRDRVYRELCELEEQIAALLDAERAAEESAA